MDHNRIMKNEGPLMNCWIELTMINLIEQINLEFNLRPMGPRSKEGGYDTVFNEKQVLKVFEIHCNHFIGDWESKRGTVWCMYFRKLKWCWKFLAFPWYDRTKENDIFKQNSLSSYQDI